MLAAFVVFYPATKWLVLGVPNTFLPLCVLFSPLSHPLVLGNAMAVGLGRVQHPAMLLILGHGQVKSNEHTTF